MDEVALVAGDATLAVVAHSLLNRLAVTHTTLQMIAASGGEIDPARLDLLVQTALGQTDRAIAVLRGLIQPVASEAIHG